MQRLSATFLICLSTFFDVRTQALEDMTVSAIISKHNPINLREGDLKESVPAHNVKLWPNGIVYFSTTADLSESNIREVNEVIAKIKLKTCVQFTQIWGNKRGKDYVEFQQHENGCYSSWVGRKGGKQVINVNDNQCYVYQMVLHLVLHALGLQHEHLRLDRDKYITVNFANLKSAKQGDFYEHHSGYICDEYDYMSIMHYDQYAFNKLENLVTMTAKNHTIQNKMGTSLDLTKTDIMKINKLYSCGSSHLSQKIVYTPTRTYLCDPDNRQVIDVAANSDITISMQGFLSVESHLKSCEVELVPSNNVKTNIRVDYLSVRVNPQEYYCSTFLKIQTECSTFKLCSNSAMKPELLNLEGKVTIHFENDGVRHSKGFKVSVAGRN